ncbi:ferrous iron transport protein A [Rhodovulum sulfidophilum]|uniref:FeoA family protein n=1 Tax=Rhodovulum sulfidophilum TaxID=35806 RepID=UPI0019209DD4|nr:FeoA family protein [Rhodovulum sulfidophilum]MBL3564634.1 ferrous iron transport protein A [Rhodovulum sulfidophilum]
MKPARYDREAHDDLQSDGLQSPDAPRFGTCSGDGAEQMHDHGHGHGGRHRHGQTRGHDHPHGECRHAVGQPCSNPNGRPDDCVAGPDACPLALADEGVWLRVVALRPGRGVHHRLIDLGLTVGARVRILQRGGGCPMLIGLGDARLALGQGLAGKIMVTPANEDPQDERDF